MLPLAVSGPTVIAVAVVSALVVLWLILRIEARDEAAERAEGDERQPLSGP